MNMPGFSAEQSTYRSTGGYAAKSSHAAATGGALVPALSFTFCKNVQRGWAIENTICGDCVDIALQCVRTPGGIICQWMPGDWYHDCWDVEAAQ